MESIGKCAGETFSSWKIQIELNIYIFLKKKTKTRSARCTLIHVMSDRSNLELSRLQIYRANEILLLFSRYFLKRDQSPWTNQMHPFILVLIILQKTLIKVGLKPMQWELTNLTVWWKQWLRSPALTTLTLRTTGLENGWSKAAGYGLELLYNVTWRVTSRPHQLFDLLKFDFHWRVFGYARWRT